MAFTLRRNELLPGQKRMGIGPVVADIGLIGWFIFSLFPIVWMVILALKNAEEQTTTYFQFSPTWSNFATVVSDKGTQMTSVDFKTSLLTSLINCRVRRGSVEVQGQQRSDVPDAVLPVRPGADGDRAAVRDLQPDRAVRHEGRHDLGSAAGHHAAGGLDPALVLRGPARGSRAGRATRRLHPQKGFRHGRAAHRPSRYRRSGTARVHLRLEQLCIPADSGRQQCGHGHRRDHEVPRRWRPGVLQPDRRGGDHRGPAAANTRADHSAVSGSGPFLRGGESLMATVSLANLRKTFGKVTAVDDLSVDIADGEFFVILGPSGAGKTTTLKSVAGLVDIDAGSVHIGGVDMTLVEPYHRNVAMAFESYALYPQKTVSENLASPLKSGRTGKYTEAQRTERINQVTTTLGINHLLKRFPRELSNGQRQRVALGRVLVRPADVYLLDEPLSHLDAKLRAAMRAELKQLGAMSNTTTVYVTHDYQEALALGDRIAVLREGRLVQIGTPEEIWRRPADTFVARSLGQPEINLVDGLVDDDRIRLGDGSFDVPVPANTKVERGDRVQVGLRPCDLHVDDTAADDDIHGRVKLAERLGRNVELTVDVGGAELIVLSSGREGHDEGMEVNLTVADSDVHVFASGDGHQPRLTSADRDSTLEAAQ